MNKTYFLEINNFKKEFSYEDIYEKVSVYRKSKVDKLKYEEDKWLSLGAEYLLMQGLKKWNIDYSKIEIGFIENNKPILKNCSEKIFFNLSHSGDMVMCVIADSEIGCDIQKMSKVENLLEIAERFFHPKEFQMLKSTKETERKEIFYRIWALKESYIKATGKGLSNPLMDFRISLSEKKPKLFINDIWKKEFILEEKQVGNSDYKSAVCIKDVSFYSKK